MSATRLRAAALLDRDGTIISDENYLADPARVSLLPGAVDAIRLLARAGVPSVVCSNQSGIARGIVSLEQYRAVRLALDALLECEGVSLLDSFACPHHPDITGPCACRKPGSLLFEQAASVHGLDLAKSMFAGDKHRDVVPAATFGGAGYLIRSAQTPATDVALAEADGVPIVSSLLEAAQLFLARTQ